MLKRALWGHAGVLADECREVLSGYFSGLRGTDGAGCGCGADLEAHTAHAEALAGVEDTAVGAVDFGAACRRPRRVQLAIDSFKGSVSSAQAEEAVAEGVRRVWPDAQVSALPLADGGEGTLDAVAACGGEVVACEVAGPLGDCVSARMLVDGEHESAVIEMAEAAGIGYSPCTEPAALAATTYGVGEFMLRAVRAGAKTIYIGLGGSATNDGGCGCAAALGVRFLDGTGAEYVPVGGTLDRLCRIDMSHRFPLLNGVEIVTMCDVDNPLCGPNGASAVFGPQKGADPDMVTRLDRNLRHLSEVIRQDLGREIADLPGAGAAGGMGAGVMAFLGSRLQMGIETVLDTVGFDALLPGATAVLTGEGRIDCQSLRGKVVIGIAHRARQTRIPVVAVVGDVAPGAEDAYQEGVTAIVSTNRRAVPWEVARQSARADLCAALEDLFRLYNAFRSAR